MGEQPRVVQHSVRVANVDGDGGEAFSLLQRRAPGHPRGPVEEEQLSEGFVDGLHHRLDPLPLPSGQPSARVEPLD